MSSFEKGIEVEKVEKQRAEVASAIDFFLQCLRRGGTIKRGNFCGMEENLRRRRILILVMKRKGETGKCSYSL